MRVYLDWNATTPPLPEVLDAMRDAALRTWANPSSIHSDGRAARAVVEDARAAVAVLAAADPRDVLLTSGGTEANNIALRSAFDGGRNVLLTSRLEHPSVARVAEALAAEGKAHVRWLRVTRSGVVDLEDLEAALNEYRGRVALVTVQALNHETGIAQPVREVVSLAHRDGARVHVDAVQAWGKIPTDVFVGADTMSLAAHKFRGPKGIGALVARPGLRLSPVVLGGAQEKGLRPGTVDPALAAGLGVAARRAEGTNVQYAYLSTKRDVLESGLLALREGSGPVVVGAPGLRASHVSTLAWPGWIGAELVAAVDLEGLSVSSGAACSAGTVEPSPVVAAMMGDRLAASTVRASLGLETTDEDIARAIAIFARVIGRADR